MAARQWTSDDLAGLARGCRISARNLQAADVDPPGWLLAHSDGRWPYNSQESLELIHPDDRGQLVEAFLTSAGSPNEPVEVHLRSSSEGYWHHSVTTWVNLIDHPDIGALLSFSRTVDGPPIEAPAPAATGEHAPTAWMMWTLTDTGYLHQVDGLPEELLGYTADELLGRHASELLPAESLADGIGMWVEFHESDRLTATNRRPWMRRDGRQIWLEDSYLKRPDRSEGERVLVILVDATERIAQEEALHQREAELVQREAEKSALADQMAALARDVRLLADEVPAPVFRCDATGTVRFHNARWDELTADLPHVTRLHDLVADCDRAQLDSALDELAHAEDSERRALEVASADGAHRWLVTLRCLGTDPGATDASFMGSIDDVTLEAALRHEASHDPLTGLLNRAGVEARLADTLADDPESILVLFVDLDGFKAVNDTYGHPAGDVVLREIGMRLQSGVRPHDLVARYGGDEFVVVGLDAGSASTHHIVDRLMIGLGGVIAFPGGTWSPRASIGTARGHIGDDIGSLIDRADQAMFDEKRRRKQSRR